MSDHFYTTECEACGWPITDGDDVCGYCAGGAVATTKKERFTAADDAHSFVMRPLRSIFFKAARKSGWSKDEFKEWADGRGWFVVAAGKEKKP